MVVVILGIIGAAASHHLVDALELFMASSEEAELAMETGAALERISRELAHCAPLAPGTEPVTTPAMGSTANSLVFTRPSAAAGRCGACVDHSTSVTFAFDPQNQMINRISPQSGVAVLADNVLSFVVSASADVSEKRAFTITITRRASARPGARPMTLRTTVFPTAAREPSWEEVIQ